MSDRGLMVATRGELAEELARLRREAAARYTEVDLLVAAMREHIADLRAERDRLLAEVALMREELRRRDTPWLERGLKGARRA